MEAGRLTKIELLLIALIIGVLGVMAVIAISGARSSARDAVRLSDIRQSQAGLELFFNDFNTYPVGQEISLGQVGAICLDETGFTSSCNASDTVYIASVGTTPATGLKELSVCGNGGNAYCYQSDGVSYRIEFELEHANALLGLQKGLNCATEYGYEPGACTALLIE